uniref:protein cordon-bleu-like isoform X2 n=2 Tax=Myxine glutinosa TaxID=7769 RepID=UPI00358EE38E
MSIASKLSSVEPASDLDKRSPYSKDCTMLEVVDGPLRTLQNQASNSSPRSLSMPSGMLDMAEDPYGIGGVSRENGLVQLCVILPNRQVHSATVDGSMAMMDLLIYLCGRFRLSPSSHMVEPLGAHSQQTIAFQPNTLVGTLEADTVLLKAKGAPEDKARRAVPAVVPEQTIRLAVNYAKNQRAVLRVSPYVPMEQLLPEICAKCGLDASHSELFRSSSQSERLDPAYSMAQHAIREVYVLDHSKSNLPEPVRLVVNYPRNRKTVVRVQPIFPLSDLLPEICSKCDLDMNHVEIFSDVTETHKLDEAHSLRELGFSEIFVIDRSKGLKHQHSESMDHFMMRDSVGDLRNYADQPEKENKGILGFLRVKKRSTGLASSGSRHRPVSMPCVPTHMLPPPELTSSGLKKRRAPAPPPSTMQGSAQFASAIPEECDLGGNKALPPSTSPQNEDSGYEQSPPDEHLPQGQPAINGGQPLVSTSQALPPSRGKRKAPAPPPPPTPPPPPPPTTHPALESPSPDNSEFDFQATDPPPPSDCAPELPSSDHHVRKEYFPQDHAQGDYTSLDVQAEHSTSEFPISSSTHADLPSSPTLLPKPQNREGNGERFVAVKPADDASTNNPPQFAPPPPPVHEETRTSCNENGNDEDLTPTRDISRPQAEVQQSSEGVAKPSAAVNGYYETGIEQSRKESVSSVSESSSAALDEDEGQAISAHFSQVIAELETDLNETHGTNDFALAKDGVSKATVEEPGTQPNGSAVHEAGQVPDTSSVVAEAPRRGPSAKALQFIKAYEDKQRMFNEEMQNTKAGLEKTQQQAVNQRPSSSTNSSFLMRVQQKSKGNVSQSYTADHAKEPSKSAGYSESGAASTVNKTNPIKAVVIPQNDYSSTSEDQIRKNEKSLSTENDLAKSLDIHDRSKAQTLFNEPKVENGITNNKSSAFASHSSFQTNAVSAPSNRSGAPLHRFEKQEPTPIFRQISLTRKRTDEVTRDYTPKVGLTTFKVVPSKPASAIMAERASYASSNDVKAENIQDKRNDLDAKVLLQPGPNSLASSREKISSDGSVPALSFADKTPAQGEHVDVGKRSEVSTLDSVGDTTGKPSSPQGKLTAKDVPGANAQKQHPGAHVEAPPFWLARSSSSSSSSSSSQYVTSAVARKNSLRSPRETFDEGKQKDAVRKPMSPIVPPKPTFNLVGSHIIPPPPEFSSDRPLPGEQVSTSRVVVIEGFGSMPMPYRAHRPTHLPSRTFPFNKAASLTGIAARGAQSNKDTSALLSQRGSTGNIETKSTYLETSRSRGMPQRLPRANPFFQPPLIIDGCCDSAPREPDSLSPSSGAVMFGPVQKFKTIVQKPPPKETSRHSDLMEEIQLGGSERLKKVTAEERNDKNGAVQETSHDAVLTAIRNGNGLDRLRKTGSEAAVDMANHQKQGVMQSITSGETPVSLGPIVPPPAPPILIANTKAGIPSRKTTDPGTSREALFDAIRTGDGAAHLKKVPKAFAVNGRDDPMS